MELDGLAVARALRTASKTLDAFILAKAEEEALARTLSGSRTRGGAALRVGALLLHLAARLGRGEEKGLRIPVALTHQLLADLSGSHRSTVTTLLNDWIYDGLLRDEEKGLRILKPKAFQEQIQGGRVR
jgi:CRP-like cAMP-binding protein